MSLGTIADEANRVFSGGHAALERASLVLRRFVCPDPVAGSRELPRRVEVDGGPLGPQVRGLFSVRKIFALAIERIGVEPGAGLGRKSATGESRAHERADKSRSSIHDTVRTGAALAICR